MKNLLKINFKPEWLGLGACAVVFFVIAFWSWRTTPAFWFDEGIYYQIVKNWAEKGILGLTLAPGIYSDLSLISVGYSVFYPAVLVFKIFGSSLEALRLTAIMFMTGFVAVFYLLAKELFGSRQAWLSLALLVVFSPLYGNGKSFLGEVPGLFYFMTALYFTVRLEKSGHNYLGFFSGIFLGLAVSAKPVYLVILPAIGLALLCKSKYFFVRSRGWAVVLAILGFLGPALVWLITQFGVESKSQEILTHYSNPYYITNFWPIITANIKRFFTESTPLHFLGLLVTSTLYLGLKWKRKESIYLAEYAILLFSFLILGFYLRTAGWYRYFFPAHALLFIFLSPGLTSIVKLAPKLFKKPNIWVFLTLAGLFLAQIRPLSQEALSSKMDAPTALKPSLENLQPDGPVLFYSVPQITAIYPGSEYTQYIEMSEHLSLGEKPLEKITSGFFSIIVIEAARTRSESQEKQIKIPSCYELQNSVRGLELYRRVTPSC